MDKFVRWWFFKFRSPLQHTSPVILQHFRGTFSVWGLMFKCHCYSKGGDGGSGGCSVKITARTCGATYKPFRTFLSQGHCWVWPCPRCKNDNCKSWWVWFLPSSPYVGLATLCFEPRNSSFWNRTFGWFFATWGKRLTTFDFDLTLVVMCTGGPYFWFSVFTGSCLKSNTPGRNL